MVWHSGRVRKHGGVGKGIVPGKEENGRFCGRWKAGKKEGTGSVFDGLARFVLWSSGGGGLVCGGGGVEEPAAQDHVGFAGMGIDVGGGGDIGVTHEVFGGIERDARPL